MIDNVNPKQNPITTIIGGVLIIVSLILFIVPVFVETVEEVNWYMPTGIGVVGILLLLSPDTLLGIIKAKSDKI